MIPVVESLGAICYPTSLVKVFSIQAPGGGGGSRGLSFLLGGP